MEGISESRVRPHNAWDQYKNNIQLYIEQKEQFKDNIARLRQATIGYIGTVWDAARTQFIKEKWANLDQALKHMRTFLGQIKKELDPNSLVYQGLLYSFNMLMISAVSLKQSHMQCILRSVSDQLSDKQREKIELANQIGGSDLLLPENRAALHAWEQYEKAIQAFINAKKMIRNVLKKNVVIYNKQVWHAAQIKTMQAHGSNLDKELDNMTRFTEQIIVALHPNSLVYQSVRYDNQKFIDEGIALKKCYIRFIVEFAIHQLSDEQYQPNYYIELAKQMKVPNSVLQDKTLNTVYKDAVTQQWIQYPIGITDQHGVVQYYCAKHLLDQVKKIPKDQPYRLTNESAAFNLKDLHLVDSDHVYFKHLTNRLIFCLLDAVIAQFQDEWFQPCYQVALASQAGLPDSAFQDLKLNTDYRDAITGKWIQYPIAIRYTGYAQYYCAAQLKKQLTTTTLEGERYQLLHNSLPLALQDFVLVEPNSAYFNMLFSHLDNLKTHLANIQARKHNLMNIIQSAKMQFSFQAYQPKEIIKNAIEMGQISLTELDESPAFLSFRDKSTREWIRFPICRTIEHEGQEVCREYYCASVLEHGLNQCADTDPFPLLEEFQHATFKVESTVRQSGSYLDILYRCLAPRISRQPSLGSISSGFFSPPNSSESSLNGLYSYPVVPSLHSSESQVSQEYEEQPAVSVYITF